MSPTSLALSSVLDDDDINEVINMAACRPERTVSMEQSFFDGMTKLARQERNLEVDHSAPIKPKGNLGWYFADVRALTHGGDDGHGIRDEEADSLRRAILTNPAQIIGLSGCDRQLEKDLGAAVATNRLTGQPLLEPAVADSVSQVSAFQHLVMRGREPFSVLVGVRALTGKQLTLKNGDAWSTHATETSWHTAGR